jgi:hypothetical protein
VGRNTAKVNMKGVKDRESTEEGTTTNTWGNSTAEEPFALRIVN